MGTSARLTRGRLAGVEECWAGRRPSVGSGEMGREGDEALQVKSIGAFLSVTGVVIIPNGVCEALLGEST